MLAPNKCIAANVSSLAEFNDQKAPLVFVTWGYWGYFSHLLLLFLLETIVKFSVLSFTCNTFDEGHSLKLFL